jgi:hypothetical protein
MAPPRQRHHTSYERYNAQSSNSYAPLDRKPSYAFDRPNIPYKFYDGPLDPVHRLRLCHSRSKHFPDDTGTVSHFLQPYHTISEMITQGLPPRNELTGKSSHSRASTISHDTPNQHAPKQPHQQPSYPPHYPGKQQSRGRTSCLGPFPEPTGSCRCQGKHGC